eukprot:1387097-Amorphochlora_amoeboformis.AAC.1
MDILISRRISKTALSLQFVLWSHGRVFMSPTSAVAGAKTGRHRRAICTRDVGTSVWGGCTEAGKDDQEEENGHHSSLTGTCRTWGAGHARDTNTPDGSDLVLISRLRPSGGLMAGNLAQLCENPFFDYALRRPKLISNTWNAENQFLCVPALESLLPLGKAYRSKAHVLKVVENDAKGI